MLCCFPVAESWLTLCDPMDCSTPGFPILHHLPELAQIHVHRISISPSNEYSGLISFRMDCLDLLAVQGTLESSPTPVYKHQFFSA